MAWQFLVDKMDTNQQHDQTTKTLNANEIAYCLIW